MHKYIFIRIVLASCEWEEIEGGLETETETEQNSN